MNVQQLVASTINDISDDDELDDDGRDGRVGHRNGADDDEDDEEDGEDGEEDQEMPRTGQARRRRGYERLRWLHPPRQPPRGVFVFHDMRSLFLGGEGRG